MGRNEWRRRVPSFSDSLPLPFSYLPLKLILYSIPALQVSVPKQVSIMQILIDIVERKKRARRKRR